MLFGGQGTIPPALFGSEMRLRQNVGDCPSSIKKAPLTRSFLNGGREQEGEKRRPTSPALFGSETRLAV